MKINPIQKHRISSEMIGLFFEDINFAADGGLYAEMIENRSFEAKDAIGVVNYSYTMDDPGYAWEPVYGAEEKKPSMQYVSGSPVSENNPHYLRFTAYESGQGFANRAYDGITLRKGMAYHVSFYARVVSYEGEKLQVCVKKDGKTFAQGETVVVKPIPYVPFSDLTVDMVVDYPPIARRIEAIKQIDRSTHCREKDWKKYEVTITVQEDVRGALFEILFEDKGIIEFDLISMIPDDAVAGVFRKDLFDALKDIHPGFIRFPGGCIVEGVSLMYRYQWKNTIGDVKDRKVIPNLWAFAEEGDKKNIESDPLGLEARRKESHYSQTFGIGFYEYFLLCELLEAKPLPVLNIGTACQFRSTEIVNENSDEFDEYIQDALDLIEFANGLTDTKWGNLRASMGHPAPFGLDMVAIGNEQWNTEFLNVNSRYVKFEKAIHFHYPEMRLLGSAGPIFGIPVFDQLWDFCREQAKAQPDFCYAMDEHYYMPPTWFYDHVNVYDSYPREVGVFAGKYAAHTDDKENTIESALAEAAFMTGLEKNADVIKLVSYAPLFNRIGHSQWKPDLIWFDDQKVYFTPNYYVQKMFGNNMGTHTIDMEGQEKELSEEGIYLSLSEKELECVGEKTTSNEFIIKVVNRNKTEYTLPLSDKDGEPLCVSATIQTLICGGEKEENLPEPAAVEVKKMELDGKLILPAESFTVCRWKID